MGDILCSVTSTNLPYFVQKSQPLVQNAVPLHCYDRITLPAKANWCPKPCGLRTRYTSIVGDTINSGPGDPGPGTRDPRPKDPGNQGSSAVTGDRNATTSQNSWLYHCLEYSSQLAQIRRHFQHYPLACLHHFATSEYYQILTYLVLRPLQRSQTLTHYTRLQKSI